MGKLLLNIESEWVSEQGVQVTTKTKSTIRISAVSESGVAVEMFRQLCIRFAEPPETINPIQLRGVVEQQGHKRIANIEIFIQSNRSRARIVGAVQAYLAHWRATGQKRLKFLDTSSQIF